MKNKIAIILIGLLVLSVPKTSKASTFGVVDSGTQNYGASNLILAQNLSLAMAHGHIDSHAMFIDSTNNYIYAGTYGETGGDKVLKINLNTYSIESTIALAAGEINIRASAYDSVNNFAYFSTETSPARVIKVNLTTFTRVGAITLNSGEDIGINMFIDSIQQNIYVGLRTNPGKIVKIDAGSFTRTSVITFNAGEDKPYAFQYVPSLNAVFYGTFVSTAGKIIKIDLSTFTRSSTLTLASDENYLFDIDYDPSTTIAYVVGQNSSSPYTNKLIKVNLTTLTKIATLNLTADGNAANTVSLNLDPAHGYAYIGGDGVPPDIMKVRLSDYSFVGSATTPNGNCCIQSTKYDSQRGFLYVSPYNFGGNLLKYSTTFKGYIWGTKVTLTETTGLVDKINFYSHVANGNIRMAIYDPDKRLVWESGSVVNTKAGGVVSADISSGSLPSLTLPPGTYYLAFQTDSLLDVPSITAGSSGDGFYVAQSYGSFPSRITSETSTSNKFTMYVTYTAPTSATSGGSGGGTLPVGGGSFYNPSTIPTPTPVSSPTPAPTPTPVPSPSPVAPSSGLQFSGSQASPASTSTHVVQVQGSSVIYHINERGQKLPYPNWKSFTSYGHTKEEIQVITQDELNSYSDVLYIKWSGSSKVYLLTGGVKQYLSSAACTRLQIPPEDVQVINKTQFNSFKTGSPINK